MFKFKTISQKTRRVMSDVALGNLSNINFEESCCEKIKTLTNKDEVKICSSGNNGIFITLSAIKGDIIVPDQGGWHGFKQIAKFLDKNVITLKTDSGLIEPNYIDDLDIKEDSALIYTSFAGYCAEQNTKGIAKYCKTNNILMSLGEMPGMRPACAKVSGSIRFNFWRASVERAWILL